MRRKINLKAVAALLVSHGLLLGGCIHLLRGYQVRRNAQTLLYQADRAKADGNRSKEVARHLQAYLGIPAPATPKPVFATPCSCTKTHAPSANVASRVYYLFESILRREPERVDVRRRAVADSHRP